MKNYACIHPQRKSLEFIFKMVGRESTWTLEKLLLYFCKILLNLNKKIVVKFFDVFRDFHDFEF